MTVRVFGGWVGRDEALADINEFRQRYSGHGPTVDYPRDA